MEEYIGFRCIINEEKSIVNTEGEWRDIFTNAEKPLKVGQLFDDEILDSTFKGRFNKNRRIQTLKNVNGEKVLIYQFKFSSATYFIFIKIIDLEQSIEPLHYEFNHLDVSFHSSAMKRIMGIIQKVSDVNSTVLLLGESGVGKSTLAKSIHKQSNRSDRPFISVNCGALPSTLIESELFGYEAGAFTGGHHKGKKGLFEAANEGTIFLDEIAELPYEVQSKLLDVIQENRIRRVGGVNYTDIDVRIIVATNKDLLTLVNQKKFREDLFYRLNVIPLIIPPLRERKEDIPSLIDYFLYQFNMKYGRNLQIDQHVREDLTKKDWLGNIREIENTIERMVVTNSSSLENKNFDNKHSEKTISVQIHEYLTPQFESLKEAKEALEKEIILNTYNRYQNTYKTAQELKVDQSTISKKLKKYMNQSHSTKG
ncbi:sigma-54 interaction domain-containing protein [Metabacillus litoralis]|uniref:sigma-54 interaction domain-containing protein n=1 Tax=Metabacillus litoralis TaxID=152268 RepID=UPI000EF603EF|nr:sigma 54-interacting transcriptional regulator [Metabacillus litoralis]